MTTIFVFWTGAEGLLVTSLFSNLIVQISNMKISVTSSLNNNLTLAVVKFL